MKRKIVALFLCIAFGAESASGADLVLIRSVAAAGQGCLASQINETGLTSAISEFAVKRGSDPQDLVGITPADTGFRRVPSWFSLPRALHYIQQMHVSLRWPMRVSLDQAVHAVNRLVSFCSRRGVMLAALGLAELGLWAAGFGAGGFFMAAGLQPDSDAEPGGNHHDPFRFFKKAWRHLVWEFGSSRMKPVDAQVMSAAALALSEISGQKNVDFQDGQIGSMVWPSEETVGNNHLWFGVQDVLFLEQDFWMTHQRRIIKAMIQSGIPKGNLIILSRSVMNAMTFEDVPALEFLLTANEKRFRRRIGIYHRNIFISRLYKAAAKMNPNLRSGSLDARPISRDLPVVLINANELNPNPAFAKRNQEFIVTGTNKGAALNKDALAEALAKRLSVNQKKQVWLVRYFAEHNFTDVGDEAVTHTGYVIALINARSLDWQKDASLIEEAAQQLRMSLEPVVLIGASRDQDPGQYLASLVPFPDPESPLLIWLNRKSAQEDPMVRDGAKVKETGWFSSEEERQALEQVVGSGVDLASSPIRILLKGGAGRERAYGLAMELAEKLPEHEFEITVALPQPENNERPMTLRWDSAEEDLPMKYSTYFDRTTTGVLTLKDEFLNKQALGISKIRVIQEKDTMIGPYDQRWQVVLTRKIFGSAVSSASSILNALENLYHSMPYGARLVIGCQSRDILNNVLRAIPNNTTGFRRVLSNGNSRIDPNSSAVIFKREVISWETMDTAISKTLEKVRGPDARRSAFLRSAFEDIKEGLTKHLHINRAVTYRISSIKGFRRTDAFGHGLLCERLDGSQALLRLVYVPKSHVRAFEAIMTKLKGEQVQILQKIISMSLLAHDDGLGNIYAVQVANIFDKSNGAGKLLAEQLKKESHLGLESFLAVLDFLSAVAEDEKTSMLRIEALYPAHLWVRDPQAEKPIGEEDLKIVSVDPDDLAPLASALDPQWRIEQMYLRLLEIFSGGTPGHIEMPELTRATVARHIALIEEILRKKYLSEDNELTEKVREKVYELVTNLTAERFDSPMQVICGFKDLMAEVQKGRDAASVAKESGGEMSGFDELADALKQIGIAQRNHTAWLQLLKEAGVQKIAKRSCQLLEVAGPGSLAPGVYGVSARVRLASTNRNDAPVNLIIKRGDPKRMAAYWQTFESIKDYAAMHEQEFGKILKGGRAGDYEWWLEEEVEGKPLTVYAEANAMTLHHLRAYFLILTRHLKNMSEQFGQVNIDPAQFMVSQSRIQWRLEPADTLYPETSLFVRLNLICCDLLFNFTEQPTIQRPADLAGSFQSQLCRRWQLRINGGSRVAESVAALADFFFAEDVSGHGGAKDRGFKKDSGAGPDIDRLLGLYLDVVDALIAAKGESLESMNATKEIEELPMMYPNTLGYHINQNSPGWLLVPDGAWGQAGKIDLIHVVADALNAIAPGKPVVVRFSGPLTFFVHANARIAWDLVKDLELDIAIMDRDWPKGNALKGLLERLNAEIRARLQKQVPRGQELTLKRIEIGVFDRLSHHDAASVAQEQARRDIYADYQISQIIVPVPGSGNQNPVADKLKEKYNNVGSSMTLATATILTRIQPFVNNQVRLLKLALNELDLKNMDESAIAIWTARLTGLAEILFLLGKQKELEDLMDILRRKDYTNGIAFVENDLAGLEELTKEVDFVHLVTRRMKAWKLADDASDRPKDSRKGEGDEDDDGMLMLAGGGWTGQIVFSLMILSGILSESEFSEWAWVPGIAAFALFFYQQIAGSGGEFFSLFEWHRVDESQGPQQVNEVAPLISMAGAEPVLPQESNATPMNHGLLSVDHAGLAERAA